MRTYPSIVHERAPLSRAFNAVVYHMAAIVCPTGYDVVPGDPFRSANTMFAHLDAGGRMIVSGDHCDRSIYADPECNAAFRAWHDWTHWRIRAPFHRSGEYATYVRQHDDLRRVYGRNADFEGLLWGQTEGLQEYAAAHGGAFPHDEWEWTLGKARRRLPSLGAALPVRVP